MSHLSPGRKPIFTLSLTILSVVLFVACALAQGRRAVVVDERLAAVRDAPDLSARLVRRLGRGRTVTIMGTRHSPAGVTFYRVAATRRTRGWLQAESVVSPLRAGDDARLWRLIQASANFDRIGRARIFLDLFAKSALRPAVLLLYGEAAEEAAGQLSREAERRLDEREMVAGGAPIFTYYMNYRGLDRYRRAGVAFVFDHARRAFHYDGASWREIVRRYPHSPEAERARQRLTALEALVSR
jgi:hypothetical protein